MGILLVKLWKEDNSQSRSTVVQQRSAVMEESTQPVRSDTSWIMELFKQQLLEQQRWDQQQQQEHLEWMEVEQRRAQELYRLEKQHRDELDRLEKRSRRIF